MQPIELSGNILWMPKEIQVTDQGQAPSTALAYPRHMSLPLSLFLALSLSLSSRLPVLDSVRKAKECQLSGSLQTPKPPAVKERTLQASGVNKGVHTCTQTHAPCIKLITHHTQEFLIRMFTHSTTMLNMETIATVNKSSPWPQHTSGELLEQGVEVTLASMNAFLSLEQLLCRHPRGTSLQRCAQTIGRKCV